MKNISFNEFLNLNFKLFEGNPVLKNPLNSFVIADPSVLTPDVAHDGKFHLFCHTFFGVYHYVSNNGIDFKRHSKIVSNAMRPNVNYIDGKYYSSQYVHLSWYAPDIYVGKKVTTDDCLGGMGATRYLIKDDTQPFEKMSSVAR
mgnify:CR=1 FL=1